MITDKLQQKGQDQASYERLKGKGKFNTFLVVLKIDHKAYWIHMFQKIL